MPNLSDFDLKQMDEAWLCRQPEAVLRHLTKRLLEDLRVARDRLNQSPSNSSRPPSSMPPWQNGTGQTADETQSSAPGDAPDTLDKLEPPKLPKGSGQADSATTAESAKPTTSVMPLRRSPGKAGRALGAPGYACTQKIIPTRIKHIYPTHCAVCGNPMEANASAKAWTGWDMIDRCPLNDAQPGTTVQRLGYHIEATRHLLMAQDCAHCGHHTQAQAYRAPEDSAWERVAIGEQRLLGPRLAADVVYLSLRMRLPRAKVKELLYELFELELSTAVIDQTIKCAARSVEPIQSELVEHLQSAGVLHADETSWAESKLLLWLWVLCCSHTVLYVIGARTKEMFDNALSTAFLGMLMSDGYRAYRSRSNRLRCWAHLLRKLVGVSESTHPQAARAGKEMLELFAGLMQSVFEARDQLKTINVAHAQAPPNLPVVSHVIQVGQLKALCEKHQDAAQDALKAIAREFLGDWDAIMRVLSDPLLPLTNNAAERQLRHWVIARRISYGTRNIVGSNSLAVLASVMDTCRLRGAKVTDFLAKAIDSARHGLPVPKLPAIPAHLLTQAGALVGK